MNGNDTLLYDRVPPAHQEAVTVGDGREYPVAFLRKFELIFRSNEEGLCYSDECSVCADN